MERNDELQFLKISKKNPLTVSRHRQKFEQQNKIYIDIGRFINKMGIDDYLEQNYRYL